MFRVRGVGGGVLPAYAGMIPLSEALASMYSSAPRVCGDDPVPFFTIQDTPLCSPRMRG